MPGENNVYLPPEEPPKSSEQADPFDFALVARPLQRMYIVDERSLQAANEKNDTASNHTLVAQFNPSELEEQWKVIWSRLESPGLPHRPLQYMGTDNANLNFSLIFDARAKGFDVNGKGVGIDYIMKARDFLMSLCVPRRGATSVREGQAPRVLFVWPNFIHYSAVVTELGFKYELFDPSGVPIRYTVSVKLERVQDIRLYSEDVRGKY